jgi:hypothetical protein
MMLGINCNRLREAKESVNRRIDIPDIDIVISPQHPTRPLQQSRAIPRKVYPSATLLAVVLPAELNKITFLEWDQNRR